MTMPSTRTALLPPPPPLPSLLLLFPPAPPPPPPTMLKLILMGTANGLVTVTDVVTTSEQTTAHAFELQVHVSPWGQLAEQSAATLHSTQVPPAGVPVAPHMTFGGLLSAVQEVPVGASV
jgi:hypothetical protein